MASKILSLIAILAAFPAILSGYAYGVLSREFAALCILGGLIALAIYATYTLFAQMDLEERAMKNSKKDTGTNR